MSKSLRGSRKTVTLLAGFKCDDGYVICSDSQESVGDRRAPADKLSVWQEGNCEIAFAGSGNNGDLIDAFEQRLRDELSHNQAVSSLKTLKDLIQTELRQFQLDEASQYSKKERSMRLIIGARLVSDNISVLWSSRATRFKEVELYDLAGCEEELYRTSVEAYLKPNPTPTIAQGIFLGLYVMWLGEQTSHFIKSPVHVAVVKNHGITKEKQRTIDALFKRVKSFVQQFDMLLLACPDTGLKHGEFASRLNEFMATIISLRRDYVEEWVGEAVEEGLDRVNDPYNLVPLGTVVVKLPTEAEAIEQKQALDGLAAVLREKLGHLQEPAKLISNLEVISFGLEKYGQLTEEERTDLMRASFEIQQAALMGEYKVGPQVLVLISSVVDVLGRDMGLGENVDPKMRNATNLVRRGVVEQALVYLQRSRP